MKIIGINQNKGANFEYTMTDSDILWSLKMIYGESGSDLNDAACVLWCMANRFVLTKDNMKTKSFENLIRAYSQPINPRWYRDGVFGIQYKGKESATEEKFKRREQIRDMKEEDVPENLRKLLAAWVGGHIPNPVPRAVHFAVPSAASKSKGTPGLIQRGFELVYDKRGRGSNCVDRFGNVFYATQPSTRWPGNKVQVIAEDGTNAHDSTVADVKKIISDIIK